MGKNNRYGHPKEEVLDTLKNSKIYRTDLDGSIEIILNKNDTAGIIICKKNIQYVIDYCSDRRIFSREYKLS